MTKERLAEIRKVLEEYDHYELWMPLVEEIIEAIELEPTLLDIMRMPLKDTLALKRKLDIQRTEEKKNEGE